MPSIRSKLAKTVKNEWPLLLIVIVAIVLLIWVSPKFIKMHDEGMLTSTAMAIAEDKVLYRDVFEFWPPLSIYLTAIVFKIFDVSVMSLRMLAAALILANLTIFYAIIRRMMLGRIFESASLISYLAICMAFVGMSHHLLGQLFLLLTIVLLVRLVESRTIQWAWLSGASASLCALSMQFEGVVAILVSAAVLVTYFRLPGSTRVWASFIVASIVPAAIAIAYFAFQGGLADLFYATIEFPITQYNQVNNSLLSFAQLIQINLIIALAWFWLRNQPNPAIKIWIITTILIQLLVLLTQNNTLVARYAFFPNIIWLGCIIKLVRSYYSLTPSQQNLASEDKGRLVVAAILLGALIAPSSIRVSLEIAASWRNIALATHRIIAPAGIMYARPEQAAKAQTIINYAQYNVRPAESVYFGPYAGHYYFLTKRVSPISYSQLTPNYNPDWMFKRAVKQLEISKTRHIVLLSKESPFKFTTENPLSRYIAHNFRVVQSLPFTTMLPAKSLYQYTYSQQKGNSPQDAIWQLKEK